MKKPILSYSLLNIINSSLIILPTPMNISIWWNIGSLLGLCLINQIITGLILSMHYTPNIIMAFDSVIHIIQDVNIGWLLRLIHFNGASLFFFFIYIHIGRSIYYNSFYFLKTWMSGVLILFILMATAFMGYVLPWGQMSLWGATVITNLMSAIPYIGNKLVLWLWGGFSVNNATLNRFYSLHFILPLVIFMMMIIHLALLHETGSSNPTGLNSNYSKIPFFPYFIIKDLLGFILIYMLFMILCLIYPYILSDPENFNKANSMITPIHIQPEWYFLFAYAILRSIPNKLGGVIALVMSIMILFFIPIINNKNNLKSLNYKFNKFNFWLLVSIFILLTFIGARAVEEPYIYIGQIISIWYFYMFFQFKINIFNIEKYLL